MILEPLFLVIGGLALGVVLGYLARQNIAKKQIGTIEAKLKQKIAKTKEEVEQIVDRANQKADRILSEANQEEQQRRRELRKTEQLLVKKENRLDDRLTVFDQEKQEFQERILYNLISICIFDFYEFFKQF